MARSPADIRKWLDGELKRLRSQKDLSAEGQRRRIARAYVKANTEMQQAKKTEQSDRAARSEQLYRKMFGNPTAGDPASAINFRDAQERASRVKTADEAEKLLDRAHQTGDAALGKAVAMLALERAPMGGKWTALIDEWAEVNGVDAELTELSSMMSRVSATGLVRSMEHKLSVPPELGNGAGARALAAEADTDGDVA